MHDVSGRGVVVPLVSGIIVSGGVIEVCALDANGVGIQAFVQMEESAWIGIGKKLEILSIFLIVSLARKSHDTTI